VQIALNQRHLRLLSLLGLLCAFVAGFEHPPSSCQLLSRLQAETSAAWLCSVLPLILPRSSFDGSRALPQMFAVARGACVTSLELVSPSYEVFSRPDVCTAATFFVGAFPVVDVDGTRSLGGREQKELKVGRGLTFRCAWGRHA
jgi:hypothetical protein